jgi:hypothetical protein
MGVEGAQGRTLAASLRRRRGRGSSVGTRLYVGGLAAISLARLEVVKTEVSCTRATNAVILGDVRRGSRWACTQVTKE